jgi:uncharacterized protein
MTSCSACSSHPIAQPGRTGPVPLTLTGPPVNDDDSPASWYHLIDSDPRLVFLVDSSALFEITDGLRAGLSAGDPRAQAALSAYRQRDPSRHTLGPLPAPRAISLNVAQACNLSCSYCYADEGRFGAAPKRMLRSVARQAIDELIAQAAPGDSVLVGFIGGEPLLNRAVVHDSVAYANTTAAKASVQVGFSITTNGTLLQPIDCELFRANPFAVTVSVDGGQATHDRHRPRRDGKGSWQLVMDRLADLLAKPGNARICARATVTRDDLDIAGIVRDLTSAGFTEVGVSPVRTGPDPALTVSGRDWDRYLKGLIEAAHVEIARLRQRTPLCEWQFGNLKHAMMEIHRGSARPLPCGAGYGYLSVDADGRYATCHRTVGDDRFSVGNIGALDNQARRRFLAARLVDHQEPCRRCWARYLCGGGCHAEVDQAGRDGCDMIRGWLDFCLTQYPSLRADCPHLFSCERAPDD